MFIYLASPVHPVYSHTWPDLCPLCVFMYLAQSCALSVCSCTLSSPMHSVCSCFLPSLVHSVCINLRPILCTESLKLLSEPCALAVFGNLPSPVYCVCLLCSCIVLSTLCLFVHIQSYVLCVLLFLASPVHSLSLGVYSY